VQGCGFFPVSVFSARAILFLAQASQRRRAVHSESLAPEVRKQKKMTKWMIDEFGIARASVHGSLGESSPGYLNSNRRKWADLSSFKLAGEVPALPAPERMTERFNMIATNPQTKHDSTH
jgi:hypothetical protein